MVNFDGVLHHISKRKRVHQKLEKYPHPYKFKNYLDRIIYIVAIIGPLMALPQLNKIWFLKDATGVSFLSWFLFGIVNLIWLFYGLVHKEKPIIVANMMWVIIDFSIAVGIVIYS